MSKFKISKVLMLCVLSASVTFSASNIKANDFSDFNENSSVGSSYIMPGDTGITDTLPIAGNTPSTYIAISGTLSDSIYNKTINVTVSNFSDDMDSVNIGLYVDGIFKGSKQSVKSGNTASFELPSSGKNYQIRMSTYSSTPGTCYYSTSIS